jgi:putative lipoic acid-binding regulatory protein|tara:strand:+ start:1859 stop:2152 length:294 start_codon:yes stop_codon:yes gene_type:complete
MDTSSNPETFYSNLKEKLQDTSSWPSEYLYKFIIKSNPSKVNTIETIFDNIGAVIQKIPSKKGTYVSVSVNVVMKSPDAVIEKYKEVGRLVDGVISL